MLLCVFVFFFFKQKTAYEMRISDWSSDVCSSDLMYTLYYAPGAASFVVHWLLIEAGAEYQLQRVNLQAGEQRSEAYRKLNPNGEIGRASCRERVCQYV